MAHKKPIEMSIDELTTESSVRRSALYEPSQFTPFNPNNLFQERGDYSLYDFMRNDEQVKAVLSLKKHSVLSSGWSIRLQDGGEQFTEEKKDLDDNLNFWLESSFDNVLMQMLTALDYGFSLSEIIWDLEDDFLWIKDIKTRPPHAFLFSQDKFGNITKIVQQSESFSQIELNPGKFIRYSFQEEFQNPYGRSDLDQSYRAVWSKDVIIKFWNIFLERSAVPPTIGKYKRTLSPKVRTRFLTLLDNIQNKSSLVIPEDLTVELLESKRSSSPDFEKAIDKYNLQIARSLLMPDLLGLAGNQTAGGSYALGKKHFDLFLFVITDIQKQLARVINNSLIRPFFKLNFGIEENYPLFAFMPHTEENKNEMSKIWVDAVSKGIIEASTQEKAHLRNSLGFPDNPDDDGPTTIQQDNQTTFVSTIEPVVTKIIQDVINQAKKGIEHKKITINYKKEFKTILQTELRRLYQNKFKGNPPVSIEDGFADIAHDLVGQEAEEILTKTKEILEEALKLNDSISRLTDRLYSSLNKFKSDNIIKIYKKIETAFK